MNNGLNYFNFDLPASHRFLNVLGVSLDAIIERVTDNDDRETLSYGVQLAVQETCTNIIDHAYSESSGRIGIKVTVHEEERQLIIDLHDTGRSFDLDSVEPPNLDEVRTQGYGLYLVRQLVDEVSYKPRNGGNHWRLTKSF